MKNIYNKISQNKNIFLFFDEVYLFGSSLTKLTPNDVDLLLIYKWYSPKIEVKKGEISLFLQKLLDIEIDLTILSQNELEQTEFLKNTVFYKKIT